jgi:hypothetical protein
VSGHVWRLCAVPDQVPSGAHIYTAHASIWRTLHLDTYKSITLSLLKGLAGTHPPPTTAADMDGEYDEKPSRRRISHTAAGGGQPEGAAPGMEGLTQDGVPSGQPGAGDLLMDSASRKRSHTKMEGAVGEDATDMEALEAGGWRGSWGQCCCVAYVLPAWCSGWEQGLRCGVLCMPPCCMLHVCARWCTMSACFMPLLTGHHAPSSTALSASPYISHRALY